MPNVIERDGDGNVLITYPEHCTDQDRKFLNRTIKDYGHSIPINCSLSCQDLASHIANTFSPECVIFPADINMPYVVRWLTRL